MENIKNNVFKESKEFDGPVVKGYDFNKEFNFEEFCNSFKTTGIQSSNAGKAFDIINNMILHHDPSQEKEKDKYCTIYLGYTSNMISSGIREIIKYLCQHKMIDYIVTTAGGIEEDFMKCLADTYVSKFRHDDVQLRKDGLNRIGNMIVPNKNYVLFEDFLTPFFKEMSEIQEKENYNWTPSKMINFLGKKINNEDSVYYWCYKNNIPVFCPALTDGSIGDMLFFNTYKDPTLKLDIIEDIRLLNNSALQAKKTGTIILGGGVIKHHIFNANLMRNGLDYTVVINTAIEYDASDSGAQMNEALSWGKFKPNCEYVKIYSEVSWIFPIIVSQTFKKNEDYIKEKNKKLDN